MMERAAAGQARTHAGGAPSAEQTTRLQLLHRCCGCQQALGTVSAKLMPCFHVLCEPCLKGQIKADPARVNVNDLTALCPACERTWRWPDISDYLLAEVVASVNVVRCQMKGCPEKAEEAIAVTSCNQCGEALCQGCSDAHRRVTATTHHQLKELPVSRADASRRCRWHPKERIAFLCKCDQFICEICPSRLEHSGPHHDQRYPLHLLVTKSKTDCGQILNQNKHELTNLARSEQMVCKRIEDLKAARESARHQVGLEVVRIHNMVLEQGTKLCRMIDDASMKKQREYEQLRSDLRERHSMYQRAQCLAEEISTCEHPVAVVKSKRQLSDYVNRISNITNCQAFNGLQLQPHLKFSSVTARLEDAIRSWGQVLLDYIPVAEQQQQHLTTTVPSQLPPQQQQNQMLQNRPSASQQHLMQQQQLQYQQQQQQQQQQQFSPRLPIGSPIRPPLPSPNSIQLQMVAANGPIGHPRGHVGVAYPVPPQSRPLHSPSATGVVHHQGQSQQGTVFQFQAPQPRPGATLAEQLQHQMMSVRSPTYSSATASHSPGTSYPSSAAGLSPATSYPPRPPHVQQRPPIAVVGSAVTAGSLLGQQLMRPPLPAVVTGMASRMHASRPQQQQLTHLTPPPPLICARPQIQPQQQQINRDPAATVLPNHSGSMNSQPLAVRTELIPTTSASVEPTAPPPLTSSVAVSRSPSLSPLGLSGAPLKKTARKSLRPQTGSRSLKSLDDICANLAKSHEEPPTLSEQSPPTPKPDADADEAKPPTPVETSETVDVPAQQQETATDHQALARKNSPPRSPAPAPIRVVLRKSEGGYASTSTPPPPAPLVQQLQDPSTRLLDPSTRPQERTTPDASLVTTTRVSVQEREDSSWDDYCFVCEQGCDADTGESLGCCAKCPHVFHNSCHIPRIKQRMEELPDTWTCTLCQPVVEADSVDNELSSMERLLCEKVLLYCFTKGAKASPFNHPVDKRIISDYKRVIKKPMDFSIIARRLRPKLPNRLRSVDKFIELMNLVFRNCSVYNPPDSQVAEAGRLVYQDYCTGVKKYMPSKSHLVWPYAMLYKEWNPVTDSSVSTDGDALTDEDEGGPGPSKRKRFDFDRDHNANEESN